MQIKMKNSVHRTVMAVGLMGMAMLMGGIAQANAGGVALGSTRLIYNANDRQTSLPVINSDAQHVFLLQSWIEDVNGKRSGDFAITPPLFVIKPSSENTLRLIHVGAPLPTDRETAYWVSVKAIPARDQNKAPDQSTLQLSFTSRIKLFYRPDGLQPNAEEAQSLLTLAREQGQVVVHNPTPYYLTLVNVRLDGHEAAGVMVPPKSSAPIQGSASAHQVVFQTINDYGAVTHAQQKTLP